MKNIYQADEAIEININAKLPPQAHVVIEDVNGKHHRIPWKDVNEDFLSPVAGRLVRIEMWGAQMADGCSIDIGDGG